jgi:RNA polymerase primary sigma factor
MAKAQAREATAASNKKAAVKEAPAEDAENSEGGSDGPVLDLTDAGVKKMIKLAKQRGFVTYDELNEVLPSDEVSSEQIEDIMAMLTDMGINVVETEEESEDTTEVAESAQTGVVKSESNTTTSADRTDDPVRMYLREMGSVELLSREGEIAIAKRIEAGREAMISGLCESPLTFQAIIIWRDELNEGKILLRDIIDLEATYAGPDAKKVEAPTPEERERKEKKPARPKLKSVRRRGRNGQEPPASRQRRRCVVGR